jgi:glucosamine--fructose-6-phosphate aminotransferase (isomerizing)
MSDTRMMADVLRQPAELRGCAERLGGSDALRRAGRLLAGSGHVIVAGIGASWSAGIGVASILEDAGRSVEATDASEVLRRKAFPPGTALLVLSRSGRSVEIVALLDLAARLGLPTIGVTNAPESPLATRSDVALLLGVGFDHAVSVVTYSAIALGGALAAAEAVGRPLRVPEVDPDRWRTSLESWSPPPGSAYFLARGASLASAHEARLLWEEAVKAPATALTTGGFRHGPQEIVGPGLLAFLWIDAAWRREEDLALAADLRRLGAQVLAVGTSLPSSAADVVFPLPACDPAAAFLVDVIPAQLAAERASRARGVSCDEFRLCQGVVLAEGGLIVERSRP